MSNTKSTIKNIISLCLLPVISLFAFSFYVFWTYPVQILSQDLIINEYFLFDNPYLQKSLLVCVILFISLIITSKFLPKVLPYILGLILVFLIGTFLYKITSYNFGTFIDNNTLTTSKPILGYSFWYFTLDGIIPVISIIIAIFALKKNFYKPILLLFFLFYSTENILTLVNSKAIPAEKNTSENIYVLSNNHPNLVFIMGDSLSTPLMLDIINNKWNDKQKAWTKDFMFYDNVTTLSLGGTGPSLPNMIGGYEFAPQQAVALSKANHKKFPNTDWGSPFSLALDKVKSLLNDNIDFTQSTRMTTLVKTDQLPDIQQNVTYKSLPIINTSLYSYTPYLFRNNFVANPRRIDTSFRWKNMFSNKWISFYDSYRTISVQQTKKPQFLFLINSGAHAAHLSPKYPDGGSPVTTEDAVDIVYNQVTHCLRTMNTIIDILKEQSIYDSTRIILAADHGIYTDYLGLLLPYLEEMAAENSGVFYKTELLDKLLAPYYPPVTVMDKKFNTTQEKMRIDSRFLSIADLHGSIINTFTNNTTTIDYLDTLPPKRQFNLPSISWQYLYYIGGNDYYKPSAKIMQAPFLSKGNLSYITIKDIKKGEYTISNYNFENIGDLPPVEILE